MNFEADKAGISNKLTLLATESLDKYRQATTDIQRQQIKQDRKC